MRNFTISLILIFMAACGGHKSYTNSAFDNATANHKIVAVLPVNIVFTGTKPKKMTDEDLAKQETAESKAFQQSLYNSILRNANTKKQYTTVQIQPIEKTMSLLKNSNISFRDVAEKDDAELCKILSVDAVVRTNVQKNRYMSDLQSYGASVLNRAIFEIFDGPFIPGTIIGAPKANTKSNEIIASCAVQSSGTVLWNDNYNKEADWQRPTSEIIDNIAENFGKHFPYKKDK
jgi:hypothetical protein